MALLTLEPAPQTQVIPSQTTPLDPIVVADARAALNEELFKAAAPNLPVPEVSDEVAVASTSFADALRAATGDMPDPLVAAAQPTTRPDYFTCWDDLMARCYSAVALHQPMDEADLTPKGADRVSYTTPETKQTWHADNKSFIIKVAVRKEYNGPATLRSCTLEANHFARIPETTLSQLKGRFHDWWARERYAQATVDLEYRYKLHDKHAWYGGMTTYCSAQGCPIRVEFSAITIGGETQVRFFLNESEEDGCTLGTGSGAGGKVRINRLPQITD